MICAAECADHFWASPGPRHSGQALLDPGSQRLDLVSDPERGGGRRDRREVGLDDLQPLHDRGLIAIGRELRRRIQRTSLGDIVVEPEQRIARHPAADQVERAAPSSSSMWSVHSLSYGSTRCPPGGKEKE